MTEEQVRQAKTILSEYGTILRRIQAKERRIHDLDDIATSATSKYEATRTSGSSAKSKLEYAMIKKMDLERQIETSLSDLLEKRERIETAIDRIEDQDQAMLLESRYIDGYRWEQVNDIMHISETTSRRILKSALEAFWAHYQAV